MSSYQKNKDEWQADADCQLTIKLLVLFQRDFYLKYAVSTKIILCELSRP